MARSLVHLTMISPQPMMMTMQNHLPWLMLQPLEVDVAAAVVFVAAAAVALAAAVGLPGADPGWAGPPMDAIGSITLHGTQISVGHSDTTRPGLGTITFGTDAEKNAAALRVIGSVTSQGTQISVGHLDTIRSRLLRITTGTDNENDAIALASRQGPPAVPPARRCLPTSLQKDTV